MSAPRFSIVIPVYERERELRRALDSCMAQHGADFEVIVVDDGSRDGSAAVAAEYAGRGVRLLRHAENRGSSPARASGIAAAAGDWIVRLDSDDELLPGALAALGRRVAGLPERVGRVGLMFRYADGRESPFPPPSGETLDYDAFILWLARSELYDCLTVTRRTALAAVPLPPGRLMEMLHHLDFARRFDTLWLGEVGAIYHVDAGERQSKARSAEEARQDAAEVALVVERHGEALRRLAPGLLRAWLRHRAVSLALAGERRQALREAMAQLAARPASPAQWATLGAVAAGALDRRWVTRALGWKWWWVEERRKRRCRPAAPAPAVSGPPRDPVAPLPPASSP